MTDTTVEQRLREQGTLPVCPYDKRSPDYWTAPNDKPCPMCGGEPEGPDKCTGADLSIMAEAADRIEADAATIASLREANKALTAEKARLEDELEEANRPVWPEWADEIRKCLMGYGVDPGDEWDLPAQFEDWLSGAIENETARADRLSAELAEATKRLEAIRDYPKEGDSPPISAWWTATVKSPSPFLASKEDSDAE